MELSNNLLLDCVRHTVNQAARYRVGLGEGSGKDFGRGMERGEEGFGGEQLRWQETRTHALLRGASLHFNAT